MGENTDFEMKKIISILRIHLPIWLALFSFMQPLAALAQTNVPAPLPAAAQEALTKGITAAKLPDYPLAIRYFEEARKLAPDAPVIYLNLGLAESKIPGRELRAMACFGAYLAAYPDAPNTAAVKEQIAVLDVKNQSDLSRFLKTVEENAKLVTTSPFLIVTDFQHGNSLHETLILWVRSGDAATAIQIANGIKDPFWKAWAEGAIGLELGMAGDKNGAHKAFNLALSASERGKEINKNHTKVRVAEAQAKLGEIADALKIAESIQDADGRSTAKFLITNAQSSILQSTSDKRISLQPSITAIDWLKMLDDSKESNDCPLNTGPFLNLVEHMKSLPNNSPEDVFESYRNTAEKIISARNIISRMLKKQAQPPAKP